MCLVVQHLHERLVRGDNSIYERRCERQQRQFVIPLENTEYSYEDYRKLADYLNSRFVHKVAALKENISREERTDSAYRRIRYYRTSVYPLYPHYLSVIA